MQFPASPVAVEVNIRTVCILLSGIDLQPNVAFVMPEPMAVAILKPNRFAAIVLCNLNRFLGFRLVSRCIVSVCSNAEEVRTLKPQLLEGDFLLARR